MPYFESEVKEIVPYEKAKEIIVKARVEAAKK